MPERIPQSTSLRVPLQAYLSSDHVTPATGKAIAITISKNGAAYANPSAGATNATEVSNGSYYLDLSATDTGTAGPLWVRGAASGVDDVIAIYDVAANLHIPASVNDGAPTAGSFIGSSGLDGTHDDFYAGCTLVFVTGSLQGIARKVSSYTALTKTFHFTGLTGDADQAFPIAPSNGDAFYLIGRIGH